ncbi:MAG: RICIN domain-containing protein [Protaetiibacter sp.]
MRNRIAAVVALVVFMALVTTTGVAAYWSTQAAITSTVTAARLSDVNCTAPVKLTNGGFETPNISPSTISPIANGTGVTGWTLQNDNVIEVWRGYGDAPSWPEGAQLVELNGNGLGRLYQDVATTPGQVLHWSFWHRGRWATDTMRIAVNAAGGALAYQTPAGASGTLISTSNAAWVRYQGEYVVPAGQTSTRLTLVAVSGSNDTVGNLIDDVAFGTGPCLTSSSAIANITNPGSTTFAAGDVVEYTTTIANAGGEHAESSVFSASVPAAASYVAGSLAINGVTKSDTSGNDEAEISGSAITARLGIGATATAGGAIPPATTITVRFRATIQPSASGGSLTFDATTAFVDALAPTWSLTAASPTVTTPVVAQADLATTVTSSAVIGTYSRAAEWVFRVANNGPSATPATITVSTSGTPAMTGRTIEYNTGSSWQTAPGTTFSVGTLASGAGVDVRIRATVPTSATNGASYTATVSAATTGITDPVAGNNSASRTVVYDLAAPSVPTGVAATRVSTSRIDVTWTASTDNVGVAGYSVFRNGVWLADVPSGTTFQDTTVAAHTPYWYWVQAYDAAGNISAASAGDGAVSYATGTSYRIAYPYGGNNLCAVATANSAAGQLRTQDCGTWTNALRQWTFSTYSGDVVYIDFQSGTARRWTAGTDTSGTAVTLADAGNTNARNRWELTAYWDGTNAHLEIRRASTTNLCLDVASASTTAGAVVQQYTCNQTVAQRFRLVQP